MTYRCPVCLEEARRDGTEEKVEPMPFAAQQCHGPKPHWIRWVNARRGSKRPVLREDEIRWPQKAVVCVTTVLRDEPTQDAGGTEIKEGTNIGIARRQGNWFLTGTGKWLYYKEVWLHGRPLVKTVISPIPDITRVKVVSEPVDEGWIVLKEINVGSIVEVIWRQDGWTMVYPYGWVNDIWINWGA